MKTRMKDDSPRLPLDQLQTLVFEALGESSMCWDPRPKGVFDSERASGVGHRLVSDILNLQPSPPDPALDPEHARGRDLLRSALNAAGIDSRAETTDDRLVELLLEIPQGREILRRLNKARRSS